MRKRVSSLVLAIAMLMQTLVPQTIIAKEGAKAPSDNLVKVGMINSNSYDSKLMLELNRLTAKNRKKRAADPGVRLFGYFEDGQEPEDGDKAKYYGEVKADLTVKGLDGNPFQWKEVFGTEEVHLRFIQMNDDTGAETGIERVLNVKKAGTYTWTDGDGNPADLPLFNNKLEPLIYEVKLDEEVSDRVKLLTARLTTTKDASPTFDRPDADGRIKYHLTLEIGLQQVASSKFVSEWHTAVEENARPQLEGTMTGSMDSGGSKPKTINFNLPKNNSDEVIVKTNSRRDQNKFLPEFLFKKPTVKLVETNANGLTFDTTKKTVKVGDHKYKYDFTYDVIKGGKLTMTEILPVTFDANGGKFASITEEGAEQKIVKEVNYEKDLTGEVEKPTKDRETFKGWSETKDGTPLSKEKFEEATKNITKSKPFYAIWENNEITANPLEVKESFKDDTGYVNNFIPDLSKLKGQVKIKDSNGVPQALANEDTFEILNDSETAVTGDALKDYLYGKLQEKDNPKDEPTRVETVKAKVTVNGRSKIVEIPIKVIKNIYEAKTLTKKPYYVPADYVMVTVNPTDKAKDPQKTYYYVNKEAQVVIPGQDPTGKGDNKFIKWTMKADSATGDGADYKLADKPRNKFTEASTITAQYVSDVIPQTGGTKPSHVPEGFVEVKFVATDKATDATKVDQIFWVNPAKEVTIPVKNPVGKQYFTFQEWKMGVKADGAVYNPSTPTKFTDVNGTTITATYEEAKNIIPYDPKEPTTRPDGYVRVTFEADPGLKLTEQKAYYVKQNAGIKLGNAELIKPAYKAETGYKFKEWDKEDSLVIEATDIVVTAKATKLDNVISEKDKNGNNNDKPEGYKVVTFAVKPEDAAKGSLEGVTKFYVNPKEYVTITTPPTAKVNTGYEFAAWDKNPSIPTVYKKDTTINAEFNDPKDVIPKTKDDNSEKPAGYVTVTFKLEQVDGEDAGKIVGTQKPTYFVKPNTDVTIPEPKYNIYTGYTFKEWSPDIRNKTQFSEDTVVKGTFNKVPDIVDGSHSRPSDYVDVRFNADGKGDITGQDLYFVNPDAKITMAKLKDYQGVKDIKIKPKTGYKFTKWKTKDDYVFDNRATTHVVYADYEELKDVIPKTTNDESEKPDGYIAVTFSTETNGKVKDTTNTKTKVVYINPNKAVALKEFAPEVKPNTGFDFADWDTQIDKKIQYSDGDTIKALYNVKGDVIPQEKADGSDKPAGYFTVTFVNGEHGTLSGKTVYYVKPNKEVTVPASSVTPDVGWKQKDGTDAWDKALTQTFTKDTTITAQYEPRKDMIPQEKTDGSDRPSGYKVVKFVGKHGSLSETTVFYVNPNKEVDFTETVKAFTKTPDFAYTEVGGTWSEEIKAQKFNADKTFTFTFKKLENVIPKTKNDESEKPKGYVKVTLIPTDKATDKTNKVYFVNPKEEVKIPSTDPVGKEITDANGNTYTFTFKNWTVTSGKITPSWNKPNTGNTEIKGMFTQDTDITATYNVKAEKIVNGPLAKDGVMTPEGSKVPEAKDLIKNPYDPDHPDSTDKLPEGTIFNYTNDGKPDLSKPGKQTAKVEVKYPNGKTVVVEVPITVIKNVVPQTGTKKPTVPDNYVKVEFIIDPATGGKIADKETKIYYVNPNQKVTIPQPKTKADTGYSFDKWDTDTTTAKKYTAETTTVKGSFTKGNDIIPSINDDGSKNNKPHGYVTVTFDKGAHGKEITGETVYYVNPDAGKKLSDIAYKPKVTPDTGFTFAGWDKEDTTEIKTDITVTAQYQSKDDIVPKVNDDGTENKQPEGYITVTFDTTDKGGNMTKVVFVNPNKPVVLDGYQPKGFDVRKGYTFAGWDTSINQAIQYQDGTIIKAVYNDPWKISTTEVQGYAKVEFKSGDHGKLIGVTDYWIKPGEDVYLPAPAVEPNVDYRFAGWDKSLTVNLKEGDPAYVITATYAKIEKPKEPERIVDTRVETRVIEVPVRDRNYRKEVWYMCGFGGDFRPHDGLKRSEAAQILANALREDGYKYDPNYPIAYKDVGKNWYAEAVRITTQANVFVGYPDGYFRPDDKISTVEWIATLRRFQQIAKEDGNHMNLRTGHWATGEIEAAYKAGWLGIYPQGLATFKADTPMPREEVAAVSNRAFNRVMDRDYIRRNDKNMTHYRDVNPSMWSYDDILLASNTFMHDGRFFKAHGITQDNVIFNVNIDGLTITQDLFQRVKR